MKLASLIALLLVSFPAHADGTDSWLCAALVRMGLKAHYVFPYGEASAPRLRATARIMLTGNRWRVPRWSPQPVSVYGARDRRELNVHLVREHRQLLKGPHNSEQMVASLQTGEKIPEAFVVVHSEEESQKELANFLAQGRFQNIPRVILLRTLGYWITEPTLLKEISLPVDWSQDPDFEGLNLNADVVHLAGGNHYICLSQASRQIVTNYFKHHPQGGTLRLRLHRRFIYPFTGLENSIPHFVPHSFKAGTNHEFVSQENPEMKVVIEVE